MNRTDRSQPPRTVWRSIALAGVVVLVASSAACSSSGGSTKSSGSAAHPGGASSSESGKPVSGEPVVVGVMYTDDNPLGQTPEIRDAGIAAQKYINGHGGIGGRPLKVVPCNGKNNPQNDIQCATTFIQQKAVSVTGYDTAWGGSGVSILNKAGIVNQTAGISGPEFGSPNAFPWISLVNSAGPATAAYAGSTHKSALCVYVDVAVLAVACDKQFKVPALKAGSPKVDLLSFPTTATDMTQYASKAAETHADLVTLNSSEAPNIQIIKAAAQIGYKPQWVLPADDNKPDLFKSLGSLADGIIFWSDLEVPGSTDDPDAKVFTEAMKKYASGAAADAQAAGAFSTLMTMKTIGDKFGGDQIKNGSYAKILSTKMTGIKQFMGPKFDQQVHLPGYPNALHVGSYLTKYENGKFTLAGKGYYAAQ